MRSFFLATAIAAAVVTLPSSALAQGQTPPTSPPGDPAPDTGGNRITVGVGVASLPDYEGSSDNQFIPGAIAVGTVGGFDFFTRGTQLYVDLVPDAPGPGIKYEAGVIGGVRLDRTNRVDNLQVRALGEIDTAYEVGGFVGIGKTGVITSDYDTLTARVGVVQDVSKTYRSYVVTPQINYTTPLSYTTLVSLGASADYVGKGYGRTYFSVTGPQSLASGLRAYDAADAGWKRFNLSFFAVQSLSGDLRRGLGVGAGVLYGKMLGRYKRSPIVEDVGDADQWSFAAGLTYTF
ncbi:MipA/OmpV family protein [Sphingomonas sp. KR1UV-12]|uniref:MipA/OmpV family protein n=1 Tax=Sphingomonas aurea TaxID=3063994 RepID=A0ABT9EL49_9SPHN|nr:MipA/OmpV family protein [Sphingomonas sp. KR1UV-12]MDP1027693.1 MipA/OmpV family protein [Sphingomonas sp. KR1UV-12]